MVLAVLPRLAWPVAAATVLVLATAGGKPESTGNSPAAQHKDPTRGLALEDITCQREADGAVRVRCVVVNRGSVPLLVNPRPAIEQRSASYRVLGIDTVRAACTGGGNSEIGKNQLYVLYPAGTHHGDVCWQDRVPLSREFESFPSEPGRLRLQMIVWAKLKILNLEALARHGRVVVEAVHLEGEREVVVEGRQAKQPQTP